MKKTLILLVVIVILVAISLLFFQKNPPTIPGLTMTVDAPAETSPALTQNPGGSYSNTTGLQVTNDMKIETFAQDLKTPRDLVISPAGTMVVSELSAGKVEAIRLSDKKRTTILENLKRPHGLAFHEGKLFVAEEEQVSRYAWDEVTQKATFDKILFKLPKGGLHNTRSLVFHKDGKLYVSIGSTCNVCVEKDPWYAAVIVSNAEGNTPQVFASGLRNSVFLALNPVTNQVWATDMGRDMLGDTTPPDELNILQTGKNYGWPDCYADRITDTSQKNKPAGYCQTTTVPLYQFHAHVAPLGLAFIDSAQFPADWQGDVIVAQHGSWNSTVPVGYKVVHLKVAGNTITKEEDFITGFINGKTVSGRPVDPVFDGQGNLYLSEDKAGKIYRIFR